MLKAIDGFVNPDFGAFKGNALTDGVKEFYFKNTESFYETATIDGLLSKMDLCGVEHSILTVYSEDPKESVLEFSRKHPDRFSLCAMIDIDRGMDAIWEMEDLAKNEHVTLVRVAQMESEKPATHARYYPLYAKCTEMDMPLSMFSGVPGPRADAASQYPLHFDRVCLDFPDLRLIMNHGADPWWGLAIRLMIQYPNLYMMTSAWMPKYLPDELIRFMNTRGQNKVMWASDHPVLSMDRCIEGVENLDLREGVLEKYLFENASRVILAPRKPRR